MEIITQPSVYMLAKTMIDPHHLNMMKRDFDLAALTSDENPGGLSSAEYLSEIAGRCCYWSFDKPRPGGNRAYVDRIKEQAHGSVLEHASFSLLFTGVSRTLTHELVRHRAGFSYSQLSQRYVDESECRFVLPVEIKKGSQEFLNWCQSVKASLDTYKELVDELSTGFLNEYEATLTTKASYVPTELRKRARQTARSVLPGCTETRIVATANARAWRHFLEMRGSRFAEPEIRRLANVVLTMLQSDSPNIFRDYVTEPLPDGTYEITTSLRKV